MSITRYFSKLAFDNTGVQPQLIEIHLDHRTWRHLLAAKAPLNPGSSATQNSSVQSFRKDSTPSVMPVSCLSSVVCVMVVHQVSYSPRAMVSAYLDVVLAHLNGDKVLSNHVERRRLSRCS